MAEVQSEQEKLKNSDEYVKIKEGEAEILFPSENSVFYNPVQEYNRDMSIAVIQVFEQILHEEHISRIKKRSEKGKATFDEEKINSDRKGVNILEGLSASGLRSIRYAKELSYVNKIIINDFSKEAVVNIERNVKHNNLDSSKFIPNLDDCNMICMKVANEKHNQFQVIDLDPYGRPTPFLNSAVQACAQGM